eukprot:6689057-Lingulodinium_polyedra.AAC.1
MAGVRVGEGAPRRGSGAAFALLVQRFGPVGDAQVRARVARQGPFRAAAVPLAVAVAGAAVVIL